MSVILHGISDIRESHRLLCLSSMSPASNRPASAGRVSDGTSVHLPLPAGWFGSYLWEGSVRPSLLLTPMLSFERNSTGGPALLLF
jgi:hypothetical protein